MRRNRPVNHRSALLLVINSHLSTPPFLFPLVRSDRNFEGVVKSSVAGAVDRRIFLLTLSLLIPNATIERGTRDYKKEARNERRRVNRHGYEQN